MAKGKIYWFTGLSGAGKSTLANRFANEFPKDKVKVLDGDEFRKGLSSDLGFSMKDRDENLRRAAEVAKMFADIDFTVIVAFISPLQKHRDLARSINKDHSFFEVFIDCPMEVCQKRDPKGLYKKSVGEENSPMTGMGSPFEAPKNPDLQINTTEDIASCMAQLKKLT